MFTWLTANLLFYIGIALLAVAGITFYFGQDISWKLFGANPYGDIIFGMYVLLPLLAIGILFLVVAGIWWLLKYLGAI